MCTLGKYDLSPNFPRGRKIGVGFCNLTVLIVINIQINSPFYIFYRRMLLFKCVKIILSFLLSQ